MAEDNVGGISVSFTADAQQLQAQIQRLEQQLKTFDATYGKQRIQLSVAAPGRRQLLDTRREISAAFTERGNAGRVMAQVHVAPPDARALGQFRSQLKTDIGSVPIKVIGNFEWGQRPPSSITIPVNGGGGGRRGGNQPTTTEVQPTPLQGQRPVRPQAAAPRGPRANVATADDIAGRPAVPRTTTRPPRNTRVTKEDLAATWTQDDLTSMSTAVLRDEMRGLKGAEKALFQAEIDRRDIAAVSRAGQRPTARGLTGGMTGAYGFGAPMAAHWSRGATPYANVPGGQTIAAAGRRGAFPLPVRDIYDPYPAGAEAQAARKALKPIGASELGNVSEKAMAQRLRQIMDKVTPEAMQAGMGWYQRAGELAQAMGSGTGLGRKQIAGATAAFSQNASWSENVRNVQDFFTALKRGARTVGEVEFEVAKIRKNLSFNALGLEGRTQQALDLAMSKDPEATLRGPKGQGNPKIAAFYRALLGDPTSFTTDRHMAIAMAGRPIDSSQKVHDPFQRAGRRVAGERGMSAADLQSVVWTMLLGTEFAGADPYGMLTGQMGPGQAMRRPRARVAPGAAAGRPVARGLAGQFDPYGRTPMPGEPGFDAFSQAQYAAIHGPLQPRARAQNVTAQVARQDMQPPSIVDLSAGRFRSGGGTGQRGRFINEQTYLEEMGMYKNRFRAVGQQPVRARAAEAEVEPYTPTGAGANLTPQELVNALELPEGHPRQVAALAQIQATQPPSKREMRAGGKQYPGGMFPRAAATRRASLAERERALAGSETLSEGFQGRLGFEERLIGARQATTVRAPGTFLAGLLSNLTGGARAKELQQQATRAVSHLRTEEDKLVGAYTKEYDIQQKFQAADSPAQRKAITADLHAQYEVVEQLEGGYRKAFEEADKLTGAAQKAAGGGLRNLTAGFVGGIAGGLAFGVGMQALQATIEGVSQALTPHIAAMTNYSEVAGETSKNLGELVRQQHGLAEPAVAQAFAAAGFKGPVAERVRPQITEIAQIQAGLGAYRDQAALLQTAFNFQNGNGIPGVTSSTGGGIFGLGAEKGLVETIKEQVQTIRPARQGGQPYEGYTGYSGYQPNMTEDAYAASLEKYTKQIDLLNDQLAGFGISVRAATDAEKESGATAKQREEIGLMPGDQAKPFADALASAELVVTSKNGDLLTEAQLSEGLISGLKDLSKSSAKDLVGLMRPQIEAQRALFRLQSDFQRDQMNPAQFALQLAASPLTRQREFGERPTNVATGRQVPIPAMFRGAFGGGGGNVGSQFTAAFGALAPMVDQTDDRIRELAADGQKALEALVPADQIVAFRALNKEIAQVGSQIAGLQLGVQQEQVNLQVAQYNNQLRIARRSQTDLLQLTGQMGATQGDNLGLMQRQQIMYERQTQELSLQSNELQLQSNTLSIILAQRQINFQRSLAGFVTPGETPQEIAARAKEAELEANFAQKQLDIQKDQLKIAREQQGIATEALPLSFKIQDTGFQRQLDDINAEIALLNQGITVTVHTAAAQAAIAHLTALENELVKRAATYVDEGAKAAGAFMEGVAQVKAATVDSMDTVIRETARAWNIFIRQGQYAVGALTGGSGAPPPANDYLARRDTSGTTGGGFQRAAGFYGMVDSATQMTVGEAGPETVAIIRNPRSWTPSAPSSGGWGGGNTAPINIMVTGNTIGGSAEDQERFAAIIARKVEEIQSRRGSLLGLRSV